MGRRMWVASVSILPSLALILISITSAQQPASIIGKWEGQWSLPGGQGAYNLTIKEVRADQALVILFMDGCSASYCGREIPITAQVSGPEGGETLQFTFVGAGSASITRSGDIMEGTSGVQRRATVTLKRVK